MFITFSLLVIVLFLLVTEKVILSRNIKKLPIRILVNGTRGKSSVVKLISALLRNNNIKTVSKITGVVPTIFGHSGFPSEIKRRGGARVTEQIKIISHSANLKSDAAVLECMSINPELQKIETKIFKPVFYVITNIREDHLETMGGTQQERIDAICSAIPDNSIVVTAENESLDQIKKYALGKNARVIHTNEIEDIDEGEIPDTIFPENLKIAILIARELKLNTDEFIKKLFEIQEEKNSKIITVNEHIVTFVNGFAVNDVPSADLLLQKVNAGKVNSDTIIIFNSRADRPIRSAQFAGWISGLRFLSKIIIAGDHIPFTKKRILAGGVPAEKIIVWKDAESKSAAENLKSVIMCDSIIVGIGNIKSAGFDIINSLN